MEEIVSFKNVGLPYIDDKILYLEEEIENLITDEVFDDFFEDKQIEDINLFTYFYIDDLLDKYFENCPNDTKIVIKEIHNLIKQIIELLKRRLMIKINYDEICGAMENDGSSLYFSRKEPDLYDQVSFGYIDKLFSNPLDYPFFEYKIKKSIFNIFKKKEDLYAITYDEMKNRIYYYKKNSRILKKEKEINNFLN